MNEQEFQSIGNGKCRYAKDGHVKLLQSVPYASMSKKDREPTEKQAVSQRKHAGRTSKFAPNQTFKQPMKNLNIKMSLN